MSVALRCCPTQRMIVHAETLEHFTDYHVARGTPIWAVLPSDNQRFAPAPAAGMIQFLIPLRHENEHLALA